jgi:FixJ family two-component response regulator
MDAGAVAFIDKPFEEARLLEVLRAITRYPSS